MSEAPDSHRFAQENPYGQTGSEGPYPGMPGAFGADVSNQLDELFGQPPVDPNTILDIDPRDIHDGEREPLYGDGGRSIYGDTRTYGPDDWLRDRMAMASEVKQRTPADEFEKDAKRDKDKYPENRYIEDGFYLPENVARQQAAEAAFAPPSDPEWLAVKEQRRKQDLRRQAAVRTAARSALVDAGIISPEVEEKEHGHREKASRRATEKTPGGRNGEAKRKHPRPRDTWELGLMYLRGDISKQQPPAMSPASLATRYVRTLKLDQEGIAQGLSEAEARKQAIDKIMPEAQAHFERMQELGFIDKSHVSIDANDPSHDSGTTGYAVIGTPDVIGSELDSHRKHRNS